MKITVKISHIIIIIIVTIILNIIFYQYFTKSESTIHIEAINETFAMGNNLIHIGYPNRNCYREKLNNYIELHEKAKELDKLFQSEFTNKYNSCLKQAKLVKFEYKPDLQQAIAIYRCESNGIGEEVKVSNYQKSCSYTEYLTKWNFPIGKYTSVSTP